MKKLVDGCVNAIKNDVQVIYRYKTLNMHLYIFLFNLLNSE